MSVHGRRATIIKLRLLWRTETRALGSLPEVSGSEVLLNVLLCLVVSVKRVAVKKNHLLNLLRRNMNQNTEFVIRLNLPKLLLKLTDLGLPLVKGLRPLVDVARKLRVHEMSSPYPALCSVARLVCPT